MIIVHDSSDLSDKNSQKYFSGFLHLNLVTDAIYLFTPVGAQSKIERQAIHEKWPLTDGNYVPGRAVTQSREVQVGNFLQNCVGVVQICTLFLPPTKRLKLN